MRWAAVILGAVMQLVVVALWALALLAISMCFGLAFDWRWAVLAAFLLTFVINVG